LNGLKFTQSINKKKKKKKKTFTNSQTHMYAHRSRWHLDPASLGALHREFLSDALVRLLCVLSLERFGDWSGETVVMPVCEAAAQALGSTLAHAAPEQCGGPDGDQAACLPPPPAGMALELAQLLMRLLAHRLKWHVTYAGALGTKHVLKVAAAREDGGALLAGVVGIVLDPLVKLLRADGIDEGWVLWSLFFVCLFVCLFF
jgi:hypothetical protein